MTARQFYIMLSLFVIMTKMQRFPCLLFAEFGKDGYLIIFIYAIINLLLIFLAFFIYKHLNREKFKKNKFFIKLIKNFCLIITSAYFFIQALLLFEHVQNIFADTLFDRFSWAIFSLLFLFAVFYLAKTGIKNIALNFELFMIIIVGSISLISVLGITHADYSFILPLETINLADFATKGFEFNVWFGDFFIILYMLFHTEKAKLSKTILCYGFSMLFLIFLTITFFGVYRDYTALQPGLISSITEQSMLGMNIGRVDWFLILFAEIGTILSCGVCFYFSNKSMCAVLKNIKPLYIELAIAILFYIMNVFVLVDKFIVKEFFFGFGAILSLSLKIIALVLFLIGAIKHYYQKENRNMKETENAEIL